MALPKVYKKTFNDKTGALIIAPSVSGRIYNVVAFSVHNNEPVVTDAARVRIYSNPGGDLYGTSSAGAIYLSGRGDNFFLPFRVTDPYFSTNENADLVIFSGFSRHISGIIYYTVTNV